MTEEQRAASKAARKAYMKEYHKQWYVKNRDAVIDRVTKFREENPQVIRERKAKYAEENKEAIAARRAAKYLERQEEIRVKQAVYYQSNKEKVKQRVAKYREENPGVVKEWRKANIERISSCFATWSRANRPHINNYQAARKAERLLATPAWADAFAISEAYELAQLRSKLTGVKWHVDHKVPLRSKIVCGLHCEFNLQVLPGKENISKGNRFGQVCLDVFKYYL